MSQTAEAESFFKRILALPNGPGVSLDKALEPSLNDEAELRRLFATAKRNPRIQNPYVGLVDIFDAPSNIRITRARVVKDEDDLNAHYVMPLSNSSRRNEGVPAMVADLDEFKKHWSIFTENSLSQLLDWNNVIAAGGSVLACLSPLPEHAKVSKRAIRKFFHSAAYPTSDVDLFLWGMTPEQAEIRINAIYEAVRDSIPWDVTCVRTKHTVSIHSQYPYRSIQIILRLYTSPAEILAGFDIDAPCCAYDGNRVWANPRAIVAMMRQCNTVDMSRRSPSYEVRLAKYSSRAFEVYIPTLKRADIDPTIYERSIARIEGLARLLVLEKLSTTTTRDAFLQSRRELRGRPVPFNRHSRRNRKQKGDLKADTSIGGLELNDYDVASLHIPYGPGWDARRIDRLVYQTDLGMNSPFNPKNKERRLHRHPAFFGTMPECLEDCCEHCPEPIDEDERKLREEEDKQYIQGRITFIQEDPGRQSISGSFNPIDVGEWSGQVYIATTDRFFAAIAAHDRAAFSTILQAQLSGNSADGVDHLNRRDHVGRTPLHVAILAKSVDIACELIDAGARMTARLVDGRTSLHLAAQLDELAIVRKLLERNALNKEQAGKKEEEDVIEKQEVTDRLSSEDDWSSEDDGVEVLADDEDEGEEEDDDDDEHEGDNEKLKTNLNSAEVPTAVPTDGVPDDDNDDVPDILDINLPDWDLGFTPLAYAVFSGSLPVIEELLTAGADVTLFAKGSAMDASPLHPLTLTTLMDDEERACAVAERLILAGASSSTADAEMCTIFHRAIAANKSKLVSTLLCRDPKAGTVINFPMLNHNAVIIPLVTAITKADYAMLATLLAHGAKIETPEEDVARARLSARNRYFYSPQSGELSAPLETSIARRDNIIHLLVALGADFNVGTKQSMSSYSQPHQRWSILDYVRFAIQDLSIQLANQSNAEQLNLRQEELPSVYGWRQFYASFEQKLVSAREKAAEKQSNIDQEQQRRNLIGVRDYFIEVEGLLVSRGAKTWNELYPERPSSFILLSQQQSPPVPGPPVTSSRYTRIGLSPYQQSPMPKYMEQSYHELYEACYTGNNTKVQQMCLPRPGTELRYTLQIAVQISVSPAVLTAIMSGAMTQNQFVTLTPLDAAIAGRQWSTARLVLAIAAAQYSADTVEQKFDTREIILDSDDESDASEESDDTVEQEAVNFTDVAAQTSTVTCNISPSRILNDIITDCPVPNEDTIKRGNAISRSIFLNDLEGFIHIAELYDTLPEPIPLGTDILQQIIAEDRPEMLDVFIRRTGLGIDLKSFKNERETEVLAANDKNRVYLGLSVHGKKRSDLARKNDPNAAKKDDKVFIPMVWTAAEQGAHKIVDYLAGKRPLAAYQFYCSSHSDERAMRLRGTPELGKSLPEWLGWSINQLNESPLTAAVLGCEQAMLERIFSIAPKLVTLALHERVKFVGYNLLMLAIDRGCDTDMIDFLLARHVSPTETDSIRGWNIFHLVAFYGYDDLLEHLLRKLPVDIIETLLAQQSKGRLNTPLHIAVKLGKKQIVKILLDSKMVGLLHRDLDGSTPLHAGVQRGFAEITKALIEAGTPGALMLENGVGETPLEMAKHHDLISRTQTSPHNIFWRPDELANNYVPTTPISFDLEKQEIVIPKLRKTLDDLLESGRLRKQTTMAKELLSFADTMEAKLKTAKTAAAALGSQQKTDTVVKGVRRPQKKIRNSRTLLHSSFPTNFTLHGALSTQHSDTCDRRATLKYVQDALATGHGLRQLVHLIDVQKSVQGNLTRWSTPDKVEAEQHNKDYDGFDYEQDVEQIQRANSMFFSQVAINPDTL